MATLRALECLVALVDEGSVTKAAGVLHMSQPALSHQIAALEREPGTPVVERPTRGIRVTAAGRAVAEEARVALAAASRAVKAGRRVGEGLGGRLRTACVETMTAWLLVPALRQWRARWPEVQLDLMEFTSADRMVEHLMADGTDLVVGPEPTATSAHVEVLRHEEMVVVTSPGHPLAVRESVAVQDLVGEPFVHYDPENGMGVWIDQLVADRQTALTVVLRTRSPRTAAQLALCDHYDIGEARRAAWSYRNAYREVDRISDLVSFEADKVEVYLDGTRLHLEPGQNVVPHGVDRGLDADEVKAH